ncbi:O-antigen ligase family protein [Sphingomonas sp.]|uniref:O-antigen ligase family protein n=1 Tax=Sphingomonas sp. TaxID=28214 RepID=UPI0035C873B0
MTAQGHRRARFGFALPVYLGFCLILGGASAAGVLANLFLQLTAIVILAVLAWQRVSAPSVRHTPQERWLAAIVLLALLLPLIQLIPLPPSWWQELPGRAAIVAGDHLLGMGDVWRPISLQPSRTLWSWLWVLAPLATLALTLRADHDERRIAVAVLILVAVVSSGVGLIQVLQGTASQGYFYATTNSNTSVGFFANSNHLATLFLLAIAFSAGFPYSPRTGGAAWSAVRAALIVLFLINLGVNRSLAGYLLAVPVTAFALARSTHGRRWRARVRWLAPAAAALLLACVIGVAIWGGDTLRTITTNTTDAGRRLTFLDNTWQLIRDSFPLGYGLGTFRWSYAGIENMASVTLVYVNHAHNDWAELVAELGLGAVVLLLGFGGWYGLRAVALWRRRHQLPGYLPSAFAGVAIIALHSVVDYPARTAAIATVAVMCVGMIARPNIATDASDADD